MSHKDKIKRMLCDAICMLCQNTVQHNAQLSIEALIGITVDNGADIVLVSIKELLEKSDSDYQTVSAPSKTVIEVPIERGASISNASQEDRCSEEDDCFPVEDCVDSCVEFSPSESATSQLVKQETTNRYTHASAISSRTSTVVKAEVEEDFMINYGHQSQQQNSRQRSVEQSYTETVNFNQAESELAVASENWEDTSFVSSDVDLSYRNANDCFDEQSYDNLGSSLCIDNVASVGRPISMWRGVPKSSSSIRHTMFRKKQKPRPGLARAPVTAKTEVDWSQTSAENTQAIPEVTHLTLYTCTLCGAQMGRLDSFNRHKRTHMAREQPRCDVCGKAFSRVDNMQAHRRRCAVSMQRKSII